MTTPQTILSNLEYSIRRVCDLLEGDGKNIVEILNDIILKQDEISLGQKRLENLLNIIVQLLSKDLS